MIAALRAPFMSMQDLLDNTTPIGDNVPDKYQPAVVNTSSRNGTITSSHTCSVIMEPDSSTTKTISAASCVSWVTFVTNTYTERERSHVAHAHKHPWLHIQHIHACMYAHTHTHTHTPHHTYLVPMVANGLGTKWAGTCRSCYNHQPTTRAIYQYYNVSLTFFTGNSF